MPERNPCSQGRQNGSKTTGYGLVTPNTTDLCLSLAAEGSYSMSVGAL